MVVSQNDRRLECEKYSSVSDTNKLLYYAWVTSGDVRCCVTEILRADWVQVCSMWRLSCVVRLCFEVFATCFLHCFASGKVRKLANV